MLPKNRENQTFDPGNEMSDRHTNDDNDGTPADAEANKEVHGLNYTCSSILYLKGT